MLRSPPLQLFSLLLIPLGVASLLGCAGTEVKSNASPQEHSASESAAPPEQRALRQKKVMVDESGEYEIINTPFGPLKRRIERKTKMEEGLTSTPPVAPVPSTPATVTAPPAEKQATQPERSAPTPSPAPKKQEKMAAVGDAEEKGNIVFNFDDADLYEVIRLMGELLNINYIVEPNVKGKVTIHTAHGLKKEDLFPVFFQILELNGLTAVKEGNLYRIIKYKDAVRTPILSQYGRDVQSLPPHERIIIQIVSLEHISASEMTKLLTPFLSADGSIVSHEDSRTMLIVDRGANVVKILKLLEAFDVDLFAKTNHRIYQVTYMDADETATILKQIFSAYGPAGKTAVSFTPIRRLNAILAISSNAQVFERVDGLIRELDVARDEGERQIYVYPVKNGRAEELSALLQEIFTGKKPEKSVGAGPEATPEAPVKAIRTPIGDLTPTTGKAGAEGEKAATEISSAALSDEVKIIPDVIRNAIVIEATPGDYRIVASVLERLDVLPRQVLIELTAAEITLDESTELGIEWSYLKSRQAVDNTSLIEASLGAAGLKWAIASDKWLNTLKALATKNKVNILATPSVLASDNREAKIDISSEIPIAGSTFLTTQESVLQTDIQYRDTGIILGVTPHINEHGLVSMDISQEFSEQAGDVVVAGENFPSFFKRNVNTTLTVRDGQTIVIGGLISETKDDSVSGAPCLVELPALRWLFGTERESIRKTELIILITPWVITSLEDVDEVTEEFKSKVRDVILNIQKSSQTPRISD